MLEQAPKIPAIHKAETTARMLLFFIFLLSSIRYLLTRQRLQRIQGEKFFPKKKEKGKRKKEKGKRKKEKGKRKKEKTALRDCFF